MRMPKVSVYLPDELHALMGALELSPSQILQDGVRAAAQTAEKNRELARYLDELEAEVGPPSAADIAEAEAAIARAVVYNPPAGQRAS
jgi:Arc/MetJ-type ribon-helix-helix transcriptional regulator